jgi:hypothetical protein
MAFEDHGGVPYCRGSADRLVGEETQDGGKEDGVMAEAAGSTVVVFGDRDRMCVEHVLK